MAYAKKWKKDGCADEKKRNGAGSGKTGRAAAISLPIGNLVWRRHANRMKFWQLILRKIVKIVATMSCFYSKMHQNRFRLGQRSRLRWGAYTLQRFPCLLTGIKRTYF